MAGSKRSYGDYVLIIPVIKFYIDACYQTLYTNNDKCACEKYRFTFLLWIVDMFEKEKGMWGNDDDSGNAGAEAEIWLYLQTAISVIRGSCRYYSKNLPWGDQQSAL